MTSCSLPLDTIRIPLLIARIERDYDASDDKGFDFGPRKLHVAYDNAYNAGRGIHVFHFGAYGCTHVLAFGHLDDALENAAAKLLEVAPGCFVEPDYAGAKLDIIETVGDDMISDEFIAGRAEQDLTYTESGYLPSWEWTVTTFESLEAVRAFAANK